MERESDVFWGKYGICYSLKIFHISTFNLQGDDKNERIMTCYWFSYQIFLNKKSFTLKASRAKVLNIRNTD